jgi:hypothetical protein
VAHASNLVTWEAEIRRITVRGQPGQIIHKIPIYKIMRAKMDWRCGSSGGMPALEVQSPEFKPQSHQKKKKFFFCLCEANGLLIGPFPAP